jgi:hypothetical protein
MNMDKYIQKYTASIQAAIPDEQLWGFAMLSTVGATKSAFVGLVSPLAGVLMRRKGRGQAAGFPMNVIAAVTPTRILVHGYRPKGTSIKVGKRVAEWHRSQVQVQVFPPAGKGLEHVVFAFADGSRVELEMPGSFGPYTDLNQSFYPALGLAPARAAAVS